MAWQHAPRRALSPRERLAAIGRAGSSIVSLISLILLIAVSAAAAGAGSGAGVGSGAGGNASDVQAPRGATPPSSPADGLETIVVTASRAEQRLLDAPAAVTVISSEQLRQLPWDDYGDLLRNVPGLNVAQTGVRDVNVTARAATSALSTSQLLLLDGRSMYLDFFGFVMWDLLPIQPKEIERIEVVRGPGSAVWGANAMTGVVNIITKRPKDMVGTTLVVGTPYTDVVHAAAAGKLGYKVSAGYFRQSAYDRPTGVVPGSVPPQTYPDFENSDTQQRRFDARVDFDTGDEGFVSVAGGYADTAGLLESGIGPFDIGRGSGLSYFKADWSKGAARVGFFGNFLRGDAANLLTLGGDGRPLSFRFATDTYALELSNQTRAGDRHTLTYGADYRTNDFTLGLAPAAGSREERGAFLQDDLLVSARLSWVVGARYDDVDPLEEAVLTPRTSLLLSLSPRHVLRFSYDEAFRTPSVVDGSLDVRLLQPLGPFLVPADAHGNDALVQEHLKAYEVGYVAALENGLSVTASAYLDETENSIDFFVEDVYGPSELPAASATLPAALVPCFLFAPGAGPAACPLGGLAGVLPSAYGYRNLGETRNLGVELSVRQSAGAWNWFANVSWQQAPRVLGEDADAAGLAAELNVPPEWRANAGVARDAGKRFWSADVNYQGKAYWADVLYARGNTGPFTQVDATVGWRFVNRRLQLKAIAQNLFDARVQQHVFGDILARRLEAEISYAF